MAQRLGHFLDGVRGIGVHVVVARVVDPVRRRDQVVGRVELGHQAMDQREVMRMRLYAHRGVSVYSPPRLPGTMVRISKMEIIGRNRMNRKSRERNRPIVPRKVIQSHIVPRYMPHDDGRKSRCRLVMTITKRSIHMPALTNMATMKRPTAEERTLRSHSACGARRLHTIRLNQ